jgi:hypothetical protein
MKIAGIGRRNKPNLALLHTMQLYSTRGWVYREGQGWVFAELTPDEIAEFKSYDHHITIPRMRVRLPCYYAIWGRPSSYDEIDNYANWFAYCTMPQAHPMLLSRFQIHLVTDDKRERYSRHSEKLGTYETWLWADEVKMCRELGCEVTVHGYYGWEEWGVPPEWKPPARLEKECTYIDALVDELAQEVRYVGKSDNPERRLLDHLKDTNNPAKWVWIQSLETQNRRPKLVILEEAAVAVEFERERYWISYYWERGHNLTNDICQYWHR